LLPSFAAEFRRRVSLSSSLPSFSREFIFISRSSIL
jgi:hypothetical protein